MFLLRMLLMARFSLTVFHSKIRDKFPTDYLCTVPLQKNGSEWPGQVSAVTRLFLIWKLVCLVLNVNIMQLSTLSRWLTHPCPALSTNWAESCQWEYTPRPYAEGDPCPEWEQSLSGPPPPSPEGPRTDAAEKKKEVPTEMGGFLLSSNDGDLF